VVATFRPWPEHDNGLGYLHGGLISAVLDCHSAAAVYGEADKRGWVAAADAALPYVTAGLDVRFIRPSPLGDDVELTAHITEATVDAMRCEAELVWEGPTWASATAVWKRRRPR